MSDLAEVAPAFVEMAHRIVWCSPCSPIGWLERRETHQWTKDGSDGFRLSPLPIQQRVLKVSVSARFCNTRK